MREGGEGVLRYEMSDVRTSLASDGGHLCEVAVVIPFHLQIEDLTLRITGLGDEVLIQQVLLHNEILHNI